MTNSNKIISNNKCAVNINTHNTDCELSIVKITFICSFYFLEKKYMFHIKNEIA